ncbi:MAG TPA: radical SAM protein [Thermoanaerobaculia bacterium]|nr:radical SAM protein [Thermoanaerobaculia bacterium]
MRRHAPHDWSRWLADEKPLVRFSPHARHRLALGYANSYHVGMSSLGFQRTFELVHRRADWACERFFLDGEGTPVTLETRTPIGDFGCIAFSVSFEENYVHLLQLLDRARVPLRRGDRGPGDPLVLMGGSCAAINPLPMAEFVDVFPLGAAENLLDALQSALEEEPDREAVLRRLAATPGFFVPAHHDAGELTEADSKLKKLELTAEQMRQPGNLPSTVIVTPHTEFRDKVLIEMSRGCPEKCRYCWATFGMGKFRWHPTEAILAAMEGARGVTDQLGFVATAVGDHPEVERILATGVELGFRCSVSSIRIPAVTEGVLAALHASGDRSITLAPETGNDELRIKMGKHVSNALLLDKVRLIAAAGFTQLKLYFLVGLPDETLDDVRSILDLAAEVHAIFKAQAPKTGVMGHLHLGVNVLVPKPYTPWQRHAMPPERELAERIALLRKGVARMPNVSLGPLSIRQAVWQTYISKAGPEAADLLERAARGQHLASLLREFSDRIAPEVFVPLEGDLRWHFLRTG